MEIYYKALSGLRKPQESFIMLIEEKLFHWGLTTVVVLTGRQWIQVKKTHLILSALAPYQRRFTVPHAQFFTFFRINFPQYKSFYLLPISSYWIVHVHSSKAWRPYSFEWKNWLVPINSWYFQSQNAPIQPESLVKLGTQHQITTWFKSPGGLCNGFTFGIKLSEFCTFLGYHR